ncbi:MAG: 3-deoxy-7-phosphoheptulonate synthase [Acidobacteriia bacterium]|nr:3-deoxy-7-phosphoheptulonate synthase [Terriglobia bacterium]
MKIAGHISSSDLSKVCSLLSRRANPGNDGTETRAVRVGHVSFGGECPVVIAGPCAVESLEQTLEVARTVKACGADMLRGGVFKPRTSPYDFQGLGLDGLKILREASRETGLPVVTEVMDTRLVEQVAEYADMLQIGSRNMQNYPLLAEAGRSGKPVLLKRGMAASLFEWLGAAEYIAKEGNLEIVLCERGIKAFPSGEYSRYLLDLAVIPAVRAETFLPVIVDPSHATGVSSLVEPASRAAIEFGSQGLIIEVASDRPGAARPQCDAAQAIGPATLRSIVEFIDARARRLDKKKAHAV